MRAAAAEASCPLPSDSSALLDALAYHFEADARAPPAHTRLVDDVLPGWGTNLWGGRGRRVAIGGFSAIPASIAIMRNLGVTFAQRAYRADMRYDVPGDATHLQIVGPIPVLNEIVGFELAGDLPDAIEMRDGRLFELDHAALWLVHANLWKLHFTMGFAPSAAECGTRMVYDSVANVAFEYDWSAMRRPGDADLLRKIKWDPKGYKVKIMYAMYVRPFARGAGSSRRSSAGSRRDSDAGRATTTVRSASSASTSTSRRQRTTAPSAVRTRSESSASRLAMVGGGASPTSIKAFLRTSNKGSPSSAEGLIGQVLGARGGPRRSPPPEPPLLHRARRPPRAATQASAPARAMRSSSTLHPVSAPVVVGEDR